MINFSQQLEYIAANLEVTGVDSYRIEGKTKRVFQKQAWNDYVGPLQQFGHNQTGDSFEKKQLLEMNLCNVIYTQLYCGAPATEDILRLPQLKERIRFMNRLSQVNQSTDQPDANWKIYHVDANGAWASKGGKLRQLIPNTFVPAIPNAPIAVNQSVHFLRAKENRHIQQVFYYVYGNHFVEHDAPQVRIYWHIQPDGAAPLIELLTRVLNEHKVAFNFKCLNHPDLFVRKDSAVLYVEKRYFDYVVRLIRPHLPSLEDYFKPGHPLFTLPLYKGVSFAEDPGDGQSFGLHRSQLIARALLVAYEKSLVAPEKKEAKSIRLTSILELLESKGITLDRLHLNATTLSLPVSLPLSTSNEDLKEIEQ